MELQNREEIREMGKALMASGRGTKDWAQGVDCLFRATKMGDAEAEYRIACLSMTNKIYLRKGENESEHQIEMELLYDSASRGYLPARGLLNSCQQDQAQRATEKNANADGGPLKDFDGREIRINETGVLTPIDAVLSYKDGKNVLTLAANLRFLSDHELEEQQRFCQAVIDGILEWEGEYIVFGGQKVKVEVLLTYEDRSWDNVTVFACSPSMMQDLRKVTDVIVRGEKKRNRMDDIVTNKRSFAVSGIPKWSVRSRKTIYIQSRDGSFRDFAEIKDVAKHEFGHALGLGDLYFNKIDDYAGVPQGSYAELDAYHIKNKTYNLVMCDHHGPISNNDIEMVILAFANNKMQHYQSNNRHQKVSEALGRGN